MKYLSRAASKVISFIKREIEISGAARAKAPRDGNHL